MMGTQRQINHEYGKTTMTHKGYIYMHTCIFKREIVVKSMDFFDFFLHLLPLFWFTEQVSKMSTNIGHGKNRKPQNWEGG